MLFLKTSSGIILYVILINFILNYFKFNIWMCYNTFYKYLYLNKFEQIQHVKNGQLLINGN